MTETDERNTNSEETRFSLCTIYKNEEKNLEKFITNHRDFIDEMILVDTGSTDRSNEIVRSFGLPYHFFQWTQNFSEARNYSLTLPTQPWIIVLDIDEQVFEEDFLRLKAIIDEKKSDAYSLRQINFTDRFDDLNWKSITTLPPMFHSLAKGYIISPLIRVFRNFKGICFNGAIHELVGPSIHALNLTQSLTDIPIYHYGWITQDRTDEEKERKKKAYLLMIKQEWEKNPSPQMAFYYLSTLDNPEEKIRLGFKLVKEYPDVKQFWEVLAQSAVSLNQWARAISYADKGLGFHPGNEPLLALKARCLNENGDPGHALEILEELLKKDLLHPVYWYEKLRSLIMLGKTIEVRELLNYLPPQFPPILADEIKKMSNGMIRLNDSQNRINEE